MRDSAHLPSSSSIESSVPNALSIPVMALMNTNHLFDSAVVLGFEGSMNVPSFLILSMVSRTFLFSVPHISAMTSLKCLASSSNFMMSLVMRETVEELIVWVCIKSN